MKLFVVPKTKEYINNLDNIIIGLKDFSTNYNVSLEIDEIKELSKDKNIMVVINKTIFNNDLEKLEENLIELSKLNIEAVLFYDLSILSLKNRLNLNLNLIWNQTHMVTNYNTCNYYYNNNVYGAYLSNEITLDEQIEIKNKTKLKVMSNIISKPIMSHSRRTLLTNYFKSINKEKEKDTYEIEEKVLKNKYIVKEDSTGTSIIYGRIVNGIKPLYEMLENNFDYGIIDSTYLTKDEFNFSFDLVNKILNNEISKEESIGLANETLGTDTGFFYKKTIYKVK